MARKISSLLYRAHEPWPKFLEIAATSKWPTPGTPRRLRPPKALQRPSMSWSREAFQAPVLKAESSHSCGNDARRLGRRCRNPRTAPVLTPYFSLRGSDRTEVLLKGGRAG